MDADVKEKYEELSWHVACSVRYHDRRERFFKKSHLVTRFFICMSVTHVALAASLPTSLSPLLGVSAMFLSLLLDMTMEFGIKAALHGGLRRRFVLAEFRVQGASGDPAEIDWLQEEVRLIKADEPLLLNVLNNICHNEVAVARKRIDAMVPISFMQHLCANFFDFRPQTLVSDATEKQD